MMTRATVKRWCVILAFATLTTLWLKELSQRHARQVADNFMSPSLERVGFFYQSFWPFFRDADGHLCGPGWYVSYSSHFCLSEPLSIYVDLLGRVRTTSMRDFTELISMPEDQRMKRQIEMVEKDKKGFEELERQRTLMRQQAEQSAAPLPRAPQTGHSDGAR